jgi:hypothetical protein
MSFPEVNPIENGFTLIRVDGLPPPVYSSKWHSVKQLQQQVVLANARQGMVIEHVDVTRIEKRLICLCVV